MTGDGAPSQTPFVDAMQTKLCGPVKIDPGFSTTHGHETGQSVGMVGTMGCVDECRSVCPCFERSDQTIRVHTSPIGMEPNNRIPIRQRIDAIPTAEVHMLRCID